MAEDSADIGSLMEGADEDLLMAVVRNAEHVLRPHFSPVILRRCNLRPRAQTFVFLRKIIVTLFPGFCIDLVELFNSHRVYPFSLYCTVLRFVTMISLNEDTYIHTYIHTYIYIFIKHGSKRC